MVRKHCPFRNAPCRVDCALLDEDDYCSMSILNSRSRKIENNLENISTHLNEISESLSSIESTTRDKLGTIVDNLEDMNNK
ncbi:MAG: hypothetical protein KAJ20_00775 [Candidatus Aenigmarchaeota archaeon]|nr:hypothetical protein [Candidatus Aenigmarchaeota archaeon]